MLRATKIWQEHGGNPFLLIKLLRNTWVSNSADSVVSPTRLHAILPPSLQTPVYLDSCHVSAPLCLGRPDPFLAPELVLAGLRRGLHPPCPSLVLGKSCDSQMGPEGKTVGGSGANFQKMLSVWDYFIRTEICSGISYPPKASQWCII